MICVKFVEIGPVILEDKIFKVCQCIFAILLLSPLRKGMALHLNKLKSPSPKDALCQVWLKLAQWFLRFWRRFLKFVNVFSLIPYYLPLEKGVVLHLKKFESPSPKEALCQIWLQLDQWFLRRKWKCEKFTDRRTDRQQAIRKAHLSFQLRWAKNCRWTAFLENIMTFLNNP